VREPVVSDQILTDLQLTPLERGTPKEESMAVKDVSSMLRKFSSAATRLNAESDSVNITIAGIETQLVDANVGLEVWLRQVVTSTDAKGNAHGKSWTATRLGFAKIGNEWCLAVKPVRFDAGFFEGDTSCPYQEEYADGEPMRLLKASRQIRIRALELLPELVEQLTLEASRCAEMISNATKHLHRQ
jgi:hypothetical protein